MPDSTTNSERWYASTYNAIYKLLRDNIERKETHALGDLPKPVLRLDLCKVDDLRGKIFGNLSLVKLSRNDLTQFCRDNAWVRVVFARDVDTEYIGITDADVICFLEMELYNI
jgi:hypothetical protein